MPSTKSCTLPWACEDVLSKAAFWGGDASDMVSVGVIMKNVVDPASAANTATLTEARVQRRCLLVAS
jgi:hypothetical protein